MLRVDHSGEIAANTIYLAQSKVFALLGDQKTSQDDVGNVRDGEKAFKSN